ncbi:MAG TPA: response regulator [Chitinophagaceae bacterium]|nr:response regulator [Chitinophagaceae bacterium]
MKKRKVLMIEDDMDDRYIIETYFADYGSSMALKFFDGHNDVIQYLNGLNKADMPDLIVLDPGRHGHGTLQQLKSHPVFKAIPVVVVSEVTPDSTVKEAYRLGANSFIQKPSTHFLTKEKIETFARYWLDVVEL